MDYYLSIEGGGVIVGPFSAFCGVLPSASAGNIFMFSSFLQLFHFSLMFVCFPVFRDFSKQLSGFCNFQEQLSGSADIFKFSCFPVFPDSKMSFSSFRKDQQMARKIAQLYSSYMYICYSGEIIDLSTSICY